MVLPWRFISVSAGIVTLGMGTPGEEECAPEGGWVRLMIGSSAAPKTQDATRTLPVYASGSSAKQHWPVDSSKLYKDERGAAAAKPFHAETDQAPRRKQCP